MDEWNIFPTQITEFPQVSIEGCLLWIRSVPSAQRTVHSNGSISINGSDVEILREVSELLNIDMDIEILTALGAWGQVWENGSAVGAFKMIIDKEIDICGNFYYLTELRSKFMHFTRAYYSISMLMMMPRGAPYSALEKLVRPFKPRVWIIFSSLVLLTFIAVFIIKRRSKYVQVLFFDRNVNSPIMEMFVILFGGSQHMLPRKNFSRILLMSFAFYCFVFRAIYTGSLFKFLQVSEFLKEVCFINQVSRWSRLPK